MKEGKKKKQLSADEMVHILQMRGINSPFIYETLLGGDAGHSKSAVQIFKTICRN